MNPAPVFHEVVEPQEVNLETFVCLFNENWTVADHEYMPQFFPRFPKEFKKGNLDMLERWAKREMLTARPGATPENLLDGFKSVEDAMNYMIYKTPHFGGPKSRVGFVWQDLMAGKSVRPDQDADNGKVFGNTCLVLFLLERTRPEGRESSLCSHSLTGFLLKV